MKASPTAILGSKDALTAYSGFHAAGGVKGVTIEGSANYAGSFTNFDIASSGGTSMGLSNAFQLNS